MPRQLSRRISPPLVLWVCLSIIAWLGAKNDAWAATTYKLTIDLHLGGGLPPSDVCVLASDGPIDAPSWASWMEDALVPASTVGPLAELEGAGARASFLPREPDARASGATLTPEEVARNKLRHAAEPSCFADEQVAGCKPGVWGADKLSRLEVTCRSNPSVPDTERRVLLLQLGSLSTGAVAPEVYDAALRGHAVELFVKTDPEKIKGAVRVVGGHYVAGQYVRTRDAEVALNIRPICEWQKLVLPPTATGIRDRMTAKFGTRDGEDFVLSMAPACVERPNPGALALEIPTTITGRSHRVHIDLPDLGSVEAVWNRDTDAVRLWPTQVLFSWRPDECSVPKQMRCPTAVATEYGESCRLLEGPTTTVAQGCRYSCDVPGVALELPFAIRFERKGGEQWTTQIARMGEVELGRPPGAATPVVLDFTQWQAAQRRRRFTSVPFDVMRRSFHDWNARRDGRAATREYRRRRAEHFDQPLTMEAALDANHRGIRSIVIDPGGATERRVRPAHGRVLVDLGAPECGTITSYWIEGGYGYHEGTLTLEDGTLVVPAPEQTQQRGSFGFDLQVGGGGRLGDRLGDRPGIGTYWFSGELSLDYMPRALPRVHLGPRLIYAISRTGYTSRAAPFEPTNLEVVVDNQILGGIDASTFLRPKVRAGLMAIAGVDFALRPSDRAPVGLSGVVGGRLQFRWLVDDFVELTPSLWVLRVRIPHFANDGLGTPVRTVASAGLVVGSLGFRLHSQPVRAWSLRRRQR